MNKIDRYFLCPDFPMILYIFRASAAHFKRFLQMDFIFTISNAGLDWQSSDARILCEISLIPAIKKSTSPL